MKIYNKKERQAAADGFEIQGKHMIKNKRELRAYLRVDRMMNRNAFSWGWKEHLKNRIVRDYVMDFLVHLRKYEYYMNQRAPLPGFWSCTTIGCTGSWGSSWASPSRPMCSAAAWCCRITARW